MLQAFLKTLAMLLAVNIAEVVIAMYTWFLSGHPFWLATGALNPSQRMAYLFTSSTIITCSLIINAGMRDFGQPTN